MNTSKRHKVLAGLAVAIASLAVAAPAAQADDWYRGSTATAVRPDDRAGAHGPGAALPDESAVRPDDRAGRVSPGTGETAARPDDRGARVSPVIPSEPAVLPDDRAGVRGPGAAPPSIVIFPDGFDWTDAGIGAALAFGLVLLGSGMLLVARRHRRPTATAF
jgi:hypothetical protein